MDINELARRGGVSVATVSRALNGRPEVSPATRDRIRALADELGYAPNASARALASRRSGLVGLLWDTDYRSGGRQHPFLQEVLVGLKEAVNEHGQGLILLPIAPDDDPDGYVRLARQYTLDGVVLMGVDECTPSVAGLLSGALPCVALDLAVGGPRSASVSSDNVGGARAAVRHLVAQGHRRIATVTGPTDLKPAAERYAGFRRELARHHLPCPDSYVVAGDFYADSGAAAMRRLLALPEPPTAVFVAGDAMAIAAVQAAQQDGWSVPGDVAVVGFDDIDAAGLLRPGLTTVAQDYHRFGTTAVGLLAELAAAPPDRASRTVVLPTALVVRASSVRTPLEEEATP
ncbi:LacI family DNA-binding transcriptional regulator [Actinocatenispora rupis]|uniref:LacI family transcriptional regulator n=1 Tax=Actinocatenispora rupis TaxID=519421 RepID=A0A8J3N7R9_9ACTN|nr:LacI family DNA-binding transcriptional regulator [Actinocatenispora rupis]GID09574.1 LacI family transcriptional regulator [Actinocatenispora rupis]